MLKHYKLSEAMLDAVETFGFYKMDVEDGMYGNKKEAMHIDNIQNFLEEEYKRLKVSYREIRRANTLTFVLPVWDTEEAEEVEVKLTIRFDDKGQYKTHKYYNITFNKDLDFFVEDNNILT